MEIKEEMENVRLATDEELRIKNKEIESLHMNTKAMSASRAEALESQRSELVSMYEQLQKQREKQWLEREQEIGLTVTALENRFEALREETTSTKAALRDATLRVEQLSDSCARKDEQIRALSYRFEEEKKSLNEKTELLQRRLHDQQARSEEEKHKEALELQEARQSAEKVRTHGNVQSRVTVFVCGCVTAEDAVGDVARETAWLGTIVGGGASAV